MGPLALAAINAAVPAALEIGAGMVGGQEKPSAADYASLGRREMRNQRRIIQMQNEQALQFIPAYAAAQTKAEKLRLKGLIENAAASGFNPLTLLGAGSQSYPMGGSGGPSIGPPPIQPGLGDAVAAGLSAAARNFHYDPVAARTQELENEVLEARLGQIAQEDARQGLPAVPRTTRQAGAPISPSDPKTKTDTPDGGANPLIKFDGSDLAGTSGYDDKVTPLYMLIEYPDGTIRRIRVGPDWDQAVTGLFLEGYDRVIKGGEASVRITSDVYEKLKKEIDATKVIEGGPTGTRPTTAVQPVTILPPKPPKPARPTIAYPFGTTSRTGYPQ